MTITITATINTEPGAPPYIMVQSEGPRDDKATADRLRRAVEAAVHSVLDAERVSCGSLSS